MRERVKGILSHSPRRSKAHMKVRISKFITYTVTANRESPKIGHIAPIYASLPHSVILPKEEAISYKYIPALCSEPS